MKAFFEAVFKHVTPKDYVLEEYDTLEFIAQIW